MRDVQLGDDSDPDEGTMNHFAQTVFAQLDNHARRGALRAPDSFAMPGLTISEMERHGIDSELIERLFGPRSKIAKFTKTNANLDPERTDRAMRVLRIVTLAEKVFENPSKALMWLNRENAKLRARPFDLLTREAGAVFVEEELLRMEYGLAA